MSVQPEVSQRDLRMRSKEIMDAVESGRSFIVTRDGHQIGELTPLRRTRRFISREEFAASGETPALDHERFRADLDRMFDNEPVDRYAG